jgi:hypothetical protein
MLTYDGTDHDFTIPRFRFDLHRGLPADLRTELYGKAKPPNGIVRLNVIHAGTPKKGLIVTDTLFTHFGCEVRSGRRPYLYRFGFESAAVDPKSRTFIWTARKNGFHHAIGVMFLSHYLLKKKSVYVLEAVWIHHDYRRTGILFRYWPYFGKVYGNLIVRAPVSDSMQAFLQRTEPDCLYVGPNC